MKPRRPTRREFLRKSTRLAGATLAAPSIATKLRSAPGLAPTGAADRPGLGAIGVGGRGTGIASQAAHYGAMLSVADVDRRHAERCRQKLSGGEARIYGDYRKLLERRDIDVVTIGTPDHWHARIAIHALLAGKDIYCEKPLTLTIDEGKRICAAVRKTERVFQVGTQQRSEMGSRFLRAVTLCHAGRIGKVRKVTCAIGGGPRGGPFAVTEPPAGLDWNTWLGQAPKVSYTRERCHGTFRWWYEYSGGKMTDWGAHHVDIAHWALGAKDTGPISVEGKGEFPNVPNGYNTATSFRVVCQFAGGAEVIIANRTPRFGNGILIEGDKGSIYVDRGRIDTRRVPGLADDPLTDEALVKTYGGKRPGSHMRNFFECVASREQPISDVFSHHRALTTCHLANICIRLGRPLKWDPEKQRIVGDAAAVDGWLAREARKGFEIPAV